MTPASLMTAIPDDLLLRDKQSQNAKRLAYWLLVRGHRPSLLEIEQERQRRGGGTTPPG